MKIQDQKLVQLLQSFSPAEHAQFARFLDSPLHNQRADCVQLYRCLKAGLGTGEMPTMQQLHSLLWPGAPYDGATLRLSMNYLLRRAERFLALREILADEASLELRVLDIYRKRKLPKLFEGQLIRLRHLEKAGLPENEDHFHRQFLLEATRFNTVSERSQASEEALQKLSLALDQYFILQKLKAACSALTLHKLFPSSHSDPLLPVLVNYIETHRLHDTPAIGLYYAAYQLLAGDDPGQAFSKLKGLLPQSTRIFADEDCRALHRIALNHCIRQINGGDRRYLVEAFDLYAQGLENGVLLENERLSPWTYKNIAAAGLRTGQLVWVAQFIEAYRDKVPTEFREAFYHYNLAELALARGEFSAVVRHLRDLSFKDPFMTLNARVLQIKAHFELGEFKLIEYLLPNLKALLRRRALQSYHRENYRQFLHYLGALLNLPPNDKSAAQQLIGEMEAEAQLHELDWLRKQAEAVAGWSNAG